MVRYILFTIIFIQLFHLPGYAQWEEKVLSQSIKTVQLYKNGNQTSLPAIALNGSDVLELHFDDMDADVKNYYYTFQLCNADWSPSILRSFEYLRGFQSVRITNYRMSSIAFTRYTHYQAAVPDRNCVPTKSGNYLLRVFLNGDTSLTVCTRRLVVIDEKTTIEALVQQPFNAQWFKTYQKLQIAIKTDSRLQLFSPQDLKVVVLQNTNWKTALFMDRPTLTRGNYYEYSDEAQTAMPAGKEWRWIDLRSFRLKSDRMLSINSRSDSTIIYVKPDPSRANQPYIFYRDLNGSYTIETLDNVNPYWQGDYSYVHFSYFPADNRPFAGHDLYLFGALTSYSTGADAKMEFNAERGAYEKTLLLKQGYYNYEYVTLPVNHAPTAFPDVSQTEGNYYGTENTYTVLVYFRPFGARADELVGYTIINSMLQRPGF